MRRAASDSADAAKVLIATYEGVTLGSHIDSENLYRPYLEMVMAHVEPAESR